MISTVLVEHPWLSPSALAILVVLGPLVGSRLAGSPRVAWWLTAAALLPVAVLTLTPVDRELYGRCEVAWSLPTVGRVELAANVVLLVAPTLLAGVASRRPLVALAAGSGLSLVLEAVQALVPAIGRSCSTNDWLSNTIGAAIGATLAWAALRLAAGSPTAPPSSRTAPTRPRTTSR
ncbi:MAG TPA: VanZ family protein [Nocardioides sp.]|nr:VanZ family protein [Nocardioides sp.]